MRMSVFCLTCATLLLASCASQQGQPENGASHRSASSLDLNRAGAQVPVFPDSERLARLWQVRKQETLANDWPLGPGDVVELNVPGMDEIKALQERVSGAGTISIPFAGVIDVRGMTTKALREEIRIRLKQNYMRNPQVSLFVREYRSRQVAVVGAVHKPGLYNLAGPDDTMLSMISQAGGMRAEAAAERILFIPAEPAEPEKAQEIIAAMPANFKSQDPSPLILKDTAPIVISLDSITRSGNQMYLSMPVRPGDVIMVPGAGEVLVQGWVEKPGSYKITPGLTVMGAVAAAGGASFPGDTSSVEVMRTDSRGRKTTITADLDAIRRGEQPDVAVMEGDVIDVSSSSPKLVAYGFYRLFKSFVHVGASIPLR